MKNEWKIIFNKSNTVSSNIITNTNTNVITKNNDNKNVSKVNSTNKIINKSNSSTNNNKSNSKPEVKTTIKSNNSLDIIALDIDTSVSTVNNTGNIKNNISVDLSIDDIIINSSFNDNNKSEISLISPTNCPKIFNEISLLDNDTQSIHSPISIKSPSKIFNLNSAIIINDEIDTLIPELNRKTPIKDNNIPLHPFFSKKINDSNSSTPTKKHKSNKSVKSKINLDPIMRIDLFHLFPNRLYNANDISILSPYTQWQPLFYNSTSNNSEVECMQANCCIACCENPNICTEYNKMFRPISIEFNKDLSNLLISILDGTISEGKCKCWRSKLSDLEYIVISKNFTMVRLLDHFHELIYSDVCTHEWSSSKCNSCSKKNIKPVVVKHLPFITFYNLNPKEKKGLRNSVLALIFVHPSLNTFNSNSLVEVSNKIDENESRKKVPFSLSPSLLKSMIQKNVRISRPESAARSAHQLATLHGLEELIRRIAIIIMEDAILHPNFIFIFLCTLLISKNFDFTQPEKVLEIAPTTYVDLRPKVNFTAPPSNTTSASNYLKSDDYVNIKKIESFKPLVNSFLVECPIYAQILQIVYEIASSPIKDYFSPSKKSSILLSENIFISEKLNYWQAGTLFSLVARSNFGGMNCDVDLLKDTYYVWRERFCHEAESFSNLSCSKFPRSLNDAFKFSLKTIKKANLDILNNFKFNSWHNALLLMYQSSSLQSYDTPIYNMQLFNFPLRLTFEDLILSAVDFHCSNISEALLKINEVRDILEEYMHIFSDSSYLNEYSSEKYDSLLQAIIWTCRSGVTNKFALYDLPSYIESKFNDLQPYMQKILPYADKFSYQFLKDRSRLNF